MQAFAFTTVIPVDVLTLISMIAAAVLGAWLGAGIVARWPKRKVQIGMGTALLAFAVFALMRQLSLFPAGSEEIGVRGVKLAIAIGGNFMLGALMTLGIGLYAPCMILVSLLGMSERTAFPIMMGSCAFLMPIGSLRFIREQSYSLRNSLGLAIGGVVGVYVAVKFFATLDLRTVRWLVIVVVVYTAVMMLVSAMTDSKAGVIDRVIEPLRARRALQAPAAALILAASLHAGSGTGPGAATVQPAPRWMPATTGVTARLRGVSAVSDARGVGERQQRHGPPHRRRRRDLGARSPCPAPRSSTSATSTRSSEPHRLRAQHRHRGDVPHLQDQRRRRHGGTCSSRTRIPRSFLDAMAFRDADARRRVQRLRGRPLRDPHHHGRRPRVEPCAGGSACPGARRRRGLRRERHERRRPRSAAVWIGTTAGRVLRSTDDGRAGRSRPRHSGPDASAGIFSIAFRDARHGVVVGGDYKKENEAVDNAAITSDGGVTWTLVKDGACPAFDRRSPACP